MQCIIIINTHTHIDAQRKAKVYDRNNPGSSRRRRGSSTGGAIIGGHTRGIGGKRFSVAKKSSRAMMRTSGSNSNSNSNSNGNSGSGSIGSTRTSKHNTISNRNERMREMRSFVERRNQMLNSVSKKNQTKIAQKRLPQTRMQAFIASQNALKQKTKHLRSEKIRW